MAIFGFGKDKKTSEQPVTPTTTVGQQTIAPNTASSAENTPADTAPATNTESLFSRIKRGLARTGSSIGEGIGTILLGKRQIDDDLIEELETRLLSADVGIDATTVILDDLTARVARKELTDGDALYKALQDNLQQMLQNAEAPLVITKTQQPFVILVVGVNGVGKTTTIGKLAYQYKQRGLKVMLGAADTFRAGAVTQLDIWANRVGCEFYSKGMNADPAAVAYEAVHHGIEKGCDVIIIDTAGRLHNKTHLMQELGKIHRSIEKKLPGAPHDVLLVLDASTGQNAQEQARQFTEVAPITCLALTKLDGTAKGGVALSISDQFKIPIRFIGVGESIDKLQIFNRRAFVESFFRH